MRSSIAAPPPILRANIPAGLEEALSAVDSTRVAASLQVDTEAAAVATNEKLLPFSLGRWEVLF